MNYIKATILVPNALVDQIRILASQATETIGQTLDTMWPYPCSASGQGPAEMWMHTGFFGEQFFPYFVDPEVLATNTGMTLEQATDMQSMVIVVQADWQEALAQVVTEDDQPTVRYQRILPVNINEASVAELEAVPLISEVMAAAIVADRPWASVDDLQQLLDGIEASQIEELSRWLCI